MAAVLPFLETEEFHFPEELGEVGDHGLSGLGDAKVKQTKVQMIAASNSELTRTLWMRAAVQNALRGMSFQLVRVGDIIHMKVIGDVEKQLTPWASLATVPSNGYALFSTNSKMRCPTFDLPAGAANVGGACPGALPAQTTSLAGREPQDAGDIIIKKDGRLVLRQYPSVEFDLSRSVCSYCYASGSGYGYASTQFAEIVRFSVAQAAIAKGNAAVREAFINAVVWQVPRLPYRSDLGKGDGETGPQTLARMGKKFQTASGEPQMMIRVHSSGDFFSPQYAELWLEITRRVYALYGDKYIFWAPTRTQVLPKFAQWWKSQSIPPNFVIRPSAYGLGDYAPAAQPLAGGTSVLVPDDAKESQGVKYDHQCGVYDLKKGNKTCVDAKSPGWKEGDPVGCRACWVRPDLRVNYVAH
jgi:hypothetical protein